MTGCGSAYGETASSNFAAGGTLTVGGTAYIAGNDSARLGNVYLKDGEIKVSTSGLSEGASIGITVATSKQPTAENPTTIVDKANMQWHLDACKYFHSDDSSYEIKVEKKEDENQIVLAVKPHTHSWSFAKSGDSTVSVSCTDTAGACDYQTTPATLTISTAKSSYDYSETMEAPQATLTYSENWPSDLTKAETSAIKYWKSTDGGSSYSVQVTNTDELKADGKYLAQLEFSGKYINAYFSVVDNSKQDPTYTPPTAKSGLVYNGQAQELINEGSATGGTMYYRLGTDSTYSTSVPAPISAGTYDVYYKITGDKGYNDVAEQRITVTISQATPSGAPTFTPVTAAGKTIADVTLTAPAGWPAGEFSWMNGETGLPATTPVEQGASYHWIFIPNDTTNYTSTGGDLVLWTADGGSGSGSGSGGGGGSHTPSAPSVTVPVTSDKGSVDVSASVSGGTATVKVSDAQLDKVIADGADNVTVDVSGLKNVNSAKIPAKIISKANDAENTGLTVAFPTGSVTLDEAALKNISSGKDVTVSMKTVHNSKLTETQKNAIGKQAEVEVVVDVNIVIGAVQQSAFNGGKLTISIPYTPKNGENTSGLTVLFVRDDGTVENKGGRYDAESKRFIFETDHLSQYVLVNTSGAEKFTDVPADAWYFDALNWATARDITGGVGSSLFAPDLACTRAQIVTFLWRAAGSPAPKTVRVFSDVPADAYYAQAVYWAAENGITGGVGDNKFAPDLTCTRAQAVTFLFRAKNSPAVSGGAAFIDVSADAYYAQAVTWAAVNDVTGGIGGDLFGPDYDCTRAQIVTLLYRANQID